MIASFHNQIGAQARNYSLLFISFSFQLLCSFKCLLCPQGAKTELTLTKSQLVTGGEVVMRNFKKCGISSVHSFGKVSKNKRWLSSTTLASILANNIFWLWVLEDLVKVKAPPHRYAIFYLPSMSTVQHGECLWMGPGSAAPFPLSRPVSTHILPASFPALPFIMCCCTAQGHLQHPSRVTFHNAVREWREGTG